MIFYEHKEFLTQLIVGEGFKVKLENGDLLPGMFENDLVFNGFEKTELKKLCKIGLLNKVTTRYKGGWRNTYTLIPCMKGKQDNEKTPSVHSDSGNCYGNPNVQSR